MLRKDQKIKLVEEISSNIKGEKAVLFIDFKSVKTKSIEKLRHDLKNVGAAMRVVRKTLLGKAIGGINIVDSFEVKKLEGQVAVVFGDILSGAKACAAFAKQEKNFKFLGGILEGRLLSAKEAAALATIPSRHELLGQLAVTLNSPMRGLAVALNGIPKSLVIALNEISKKK